VRSGGCKPSLEEVGAVPSLLRELHALCKQFADESNLIKRAHIQSLTILKNFESLQKSSEDSLGHFDAVLLLRRVVR
jgi:hypothetical protein